MKKGTRKDQEKHLTLHLWLVKGSLYFSSLAGFLLTQSQT